MRRLVLLVLLCGCSIHERLNAAGLFPSRSYEVWPERWDVPTEEVFVPVGSDGPTLHGWLFFAREARGAVVILHGNTGNAAPFGAWAEKLALGGYDALVVSYRGFGASSGSPDLWSLGDDGEAMVRYLQARRDTGKLPIGLLGISLGTGAAVQVARRCPEVAAVVLDSPFDGRTKLSEFLESTVLAGAAMPFLEPTGMSASVEQPLLVVHGENDRICSVAEGVAVFQRASGPRALWVAEGAGHSPGVAGSYGAIYEKLIGRFLDRWLVGAKELPWFECRWETDFKSPDGLFVISVEPVAPIATSVPVEVLVFDGQVHRARALWEPGKRFDFVTDREPSCVSAVAFPDVHEGNFELPLYARSMRAFLEDREKISSLEPGAAQLLVGGRTAAGVDPLVQPCYAVQLARIGDRWLEVGKKAEARACFEQALGLLGSDPSRVLFLGDASWVVTLGLGAAKELHEKLAGLLEGAEKERHLEAAAQLERRAREEEERDQERWLLARARCARPR
jgi:pimeloyl-ACP methyl ester carboxylesterase